MLSSCSSCCNKLTILTLAHSLGPFILSFCFSHPYFPLFASVFLFIFNYSCPISIPNACTHPFLCLFCQKRCTSRDLYFELICVYFVFVFIVRFIYDILCILFSFARPRFLSTSVGHLKLFFSLLQFGRNFSYKNLSVLKTHAKLGLNTSFMIVWILMRAYNL